MKRDIKLRPIFLVSVLLSFPAYAEWKMLNCAEVGLPTSTYVIEFDQAAKRVRMQGRQNSIYDAEFNDVLIQWTLPRVEYGDSSYGMIFKLNRINGTLEVLTAGTDAKKSQLVTKTSYYACDLVRAKRF